MVSYNSIKYCLTDPFVSTLMNTNVAVSTNSRNSNISSFLSSVHPFDIALSIPTRNIAICGCKEAKSLNKNLVQTAISPTISIIVFIFLNWVHYYRSQPLLLILILNSCRLLRICIGFFLQIQQSKVNYSNKRIQVSCDLPMHGK